MGTDGAIPKNHAIPCSDVAEKMWVINKRPWDSARSSGTQVESRVGCPQRGQGDVPGSFEWYCLLSCQQCCSESQLERVASLDLTCSRAPWFVCESRRSECGAGSVDIQQGFWGHGTICISQSTLPLHLFGRAEDVTCKQGCTFGG